MTREERRNRINELSKILDFAMGEEWSTAYDEYAKLEAEEQLEYREENEAKLWEYFDKYLAGKTVEGQYEHFDWFSDYHKDVYGYRPHNIVVNGVFCRS